MSYRPPLQVAVGPNQLPRVYADRRDLPILIDPSVPVSRDLLGNGLPAIAVPMQPDDQSQPPMDVPYVDDLSGLNEPPPPPPQITPDTAATAVSIGPVVVTQTPSPSSPSPTPSPQAQAAAQAQAQAVAQALAQAQAQAQALQQLADQRAAFRVSDAASNARAAWTDAATAAAILCLTCTIVAIIVWLIRRHRRS